MRGTDVINWPEFCAWVDVADPVAPRLADLPSRLATMRQRLEMVELPDARSSGRRTRSLVTDC
jgi:hypothetical protein